MPREKASRKYLLTINNPLDHGFIFSVSFLKYPDELFGAGIVGETPEAFSGTAGK